MIRKVEQMPSLPTPFHMKDWKQVAADYDELIFDFEAKGDFLPLIWWDRTGRNTGRATFALPSYIGASRDAANHEAINCVTAVLGATIAGIDKSEQHGHNWVEMCESYYNTDNGENLVLNRTDANSGSSFWYEVYPHVLIYSLAHFYPSVGKLEHIMLQTADKWYEACYELGGKNGAADFNHLSYDFKLQQPVDNGKWKEPEAAAGIAWLQYAAYAKWGNSRHLEAAEWCMAFLERSTDNPFYEILLPYGAYTAARMNAELGYDYDVAKMLNWCFDGDSACRSGWGVIAERWGDYDAHGLCGSLTDWGQRWDQMQANASNEYREDSSGYAFAANTFSLAASLIPLVRYDSRFARDLGKWMLNAANNARLFYPDALPPIQQSCHFFRSDPKHVIAYEGLRKKWDHQSPYATGDAIRYSWGSIDLGLYGSSHVGIFGGIISYTNEPAILQLDCLRTDYFRNAAYPTYLYYNPHDEEKRVSVELGSEACDIYDAITHVNLGTSVSGNTMITIPADSAVLIVLVPADGIRSREGKKLLVNGTVIDYRIDY
ncbi:hypothetical protein FHS15_003232 [Paenibacillus castaneae]|uniref:hypothetical protein n=1 Tax=Paenibacillus castaneae TaxID=474957 RepID=UPI000C9B72D6|nr:hypothetical protein [Paenibacillus castaneae]NIK78094.1 hypothetical protein [Paenibacillus castaneae]